MMRSSRVREETPQPTMSVTEGRRFLSMFCREETRQHNTFPYYAAHQQTHIHEKRLTHKNTHTHTQAVSLLSAALSATADGSLWADS